jgi:hypothetical protein
MAYPIGINNRHNQEPEATPAMAPSVNNAITPVLLIIFLPPFL